MGIVTPTLAVRMGRTQKSWSELWHTHPDFEFSFIPCIKHLLNGSTEQYIQGINKTSPSSKENKGNFCPAAGVKGALRPDRLGGVVCLTFCP